MSGNGEDGSGESNPALQLDELSEVQQTRRQIAELEQRLGIVSTKLARGTRDVIEQAAAALKEAHAQPDAAELRQRLHDAITLRAHVTEILAAASLDTVGLSERLGISIGRVLDVLRVLRAEHRLYNMGTEEKPRWTLRLQPNASPAEVRVLVGRLLSERPMSATELAEATGATPQRVTTAVYALRESGAHVLCTSERERRWFRVPEGSRLVTPRVRRPSKRKKLDEGE